jgi:hypothetical protein
MTSTMELAETQLAQAMAEQGALGIGKYLAREFTPHASPATKPGEQPVEAATSANPHQPIAPKPHASR